MDFIQIKKVKLICSCKWSDEVADNFDTAFTSKHNMKLKLSFQVSLSEMTYSKSFYGVTARTTSTTAKRLVVDPQNVEDTYNFFEVNSLALIKSE